MVTTLTIQAIAGAMRAAVLEAVKVKPIEFRVTFNDSDWFVRVEQDGTVHNGDDAAKCYGLYRTLDELECWELGKLLDAMAKDVVDAGPESGVSEEMREHVCTAVGEALGDAYDCTRTWAAWGVGTMSQDDFVLVAEDDSRLGEIADAAIAAMGARQPLLPTFRLLEQAAQIALAHNYTGGGIDSAVKIRELAAGVVCPG
ncbi:TPA: hypothetical protein QDB04_000358 [Burkholderia vietnamiensis]|nr:hypothetical protein [Burkholderia vietnamiensis]